MKTKIFVKQFVMNNITYWQDRGTNYHATPEQVVNVINKRFKTYVKADEVRSSVGELLDDGVINMNDDNYFYKANHFDEYAKFLNEVEGTRIKY